MRPGYVVPVSAGTVRILGLIRLPFIQVMSTSSHITMCNFRVEKKRATLS